MRIFLFVVALCLLFFFDPSALFFQYELLFPWLPSLNMFYHVALDGVSLWVCCFDYFSSSFTVF